MSCRLTPLDYRLDYALDEEELSDIAEAAIRSDELGHERVFILFGLPGDRLDTGAYASARKGAAVRMYRKDGSGQ